MDKLYELIRQDPVGALLIAVCVVIVLLPPKFDPAIRLKEYLISKGWHPESRGK